MKSTVLIAEDEDPLRRLYATWLENHDYNVRTAEDGLVAYNQWDNDIDVAVLDRRMPEIYGGEVLSKVREEGYKTPVAMITAVDPDLDISGMEFDAYMEKPATQDKFVSTVEDLIPTVDIRSTVRDFVRTGIKIHKLQKQHPETLLRSQETYQEISTTHEDLLSEMKAISGEMNEYEREQLVNHLTTISDGRVDIKNKSNFNLITTISKSLELQH